MIKIEGIAASVGFAYANALVYRHESETVSATLWETENEKLGERRCFLEAYEKLSLELSETIEKLKGKEKEILEIHRALLLDPFYKERILSLIEKEHYSAPYAIDTASNEIIHTLEDADDEYFKDRALDIREIEASLLSKAVNKPQNALKNVDKKVILVTDNLLASEIFIANKENIIGLVSEKGGRTSHVAILARSLNIPCVFGAENITKLTSDESLVAIDGLKGIVYVNPTEETLKEFNNSKERFESHKKDMSNEAMLPSITKDGYRIRVKGNIASLSDIESVIESGGEGVGLLRSEFLIMNKDHFPTLEEESETYIKAAKDTKTIGDLTIRTWDIGGDKKIAGFNEGEENPILGFRSIRLCLEHIDLFKVQLKAILIASREKNVRIMFPMISGVEELNQVLDILDEVKEELRNENIKFDEKIKTGVMIETPSSVLISDILSKKIDFFSVGTNDLIQYTIAVDRGNEKISYLYQPLHPAVIRTLKIIVDNGHKNGIAVSVCGEMAAEVIALPLLLGLGFDELSMNASSITEIKSIIRELSYAECKKLLKRVLEKETTEEVEKEVKEYLNGKIGYSI